MKKVPFSHFLIVLSFFGLFACGTKNVEPGCSTAWGTELQNEITALSNASAAYGSDPTTANCTAYKDAYLNYLKGLKSYSGCSLITGQLRVALDDAIKEAEDELNSLCSS